MKKSELALLLVNLICFLAISALLATGHSGFASKFVNIFFFILLAESTIYLIKS